VTCVSVKARLSGEHGLAAAWQALHISGTSKRAGRRVKAETWQHGIERWAEDEQRLGASLSYQARRTLAWAGIALLSRDNRGFASA